MALPSWGGGNSPGHWGLMTLVTPSGDLPCLLLSSLLSLSSWFIWSSQCPAWCRRLVMLRKERGKILRKEEGSKNGEGTAFPDIPPSEPSMQRPAWCQGLLSGVVPGWWWGVSFLPLSLFPLSPQVGPPATFEDLRLQESMSTSEYTSQ